MTTTTRLLLRSARRAALALAVTVALVVASGCGRRPANATPEGAVRELVERMRRVSGDPAAARAAFDLLSKRTQANLAARAQRYSAASGKTIAPEAMIVPSRFLLRFEPQSYTAVVSGSSAMVEVAGLQPTERAQIPCVYEDDGWRVDMTLPSLPPVQMRPGSDP
jgi:hypothetical protein